MPSSRLKSRKSDQSKRDEAVGSSAGIPAPVVGLSIGCDGLCCIIGENFEATEKMGAVKRDKNKRD